ncbi:hypothetical protein AB1Y20_012717 [Prymnesium parvum]|uniref:Eukaryotic translation initiation factor 3 30 kDa subunit n=1 Tax=Prymnesium parvum TaxID=97485 RepID=A0AB34IJ95_PRYPA|mmetsp:Transcript_12701/g.31690  ORF Transcript_12701/g.31690 Transcript_12701/m.31690 type:complete len:239 (-) Transcript_12701:237-953(-)
MEDWEDDEWEAPSLDVNGEKESWSDEEGHDAHKVAEPVVLERQAKKPEKPKEKTLLELKIEEREAREKETVPQPASAAGGGANGDLEIAPDLEAEDNLGLGSTTNDLLEQALAQAAPIVPAPREAKLPSADGFAPKTDADFETLAKMLYKQLQPHEGKKGFSLALKSFLRAATNSMNTDETKDLSSFISVISNDKIKADREKDQKGKKKKAKGKINLAAGKDVDADFDDRGGWRDDDW